MTHWLKFPTERDSFHVWDVSRSRRTFLRHCRKEIDWGFWTRIPLCNNGSLCMRRWGLSWIFRRLRRSRDDITHCIFFYVTCKSLLSLRRKMRVLLGYYHNYIIIYLINSWGPIKSLKPDRCSWIMRDTKIQLWNIHSVSRYSMYMCDPDPSSTAALKWSPDIHRRTGTWTIHCKIS